MALLTTILSFLTAANGLVKKHPLWVVILALIAYIFFLRECTPGPKPCDPCPQFDTAAFMAQLPVIYPDTSYKPSIDSTHYTDPVPSPVIINTTTIGRYHVYNRRH